MKFRSKFDFGLFYGGYDEFAVSKERYTKLQATEIAKQELAYHKAKYLAIGNGFVRHRAGVNEDGEPCVGWWLEYSEHNRSCPAWVFHTVFNLNKEKTRCAYKDYEYISID